MGSSGFVRNESGQFTAAQKERLLLIRELSEKFPFVRAALFCFFFLVCFMVFD